MRIEDLLVYESVSCGTLKAGEENIGDPGQDQENAKSR